jgi:hypothetical protein
LPQNIKTEVQAAESILTTLKLSTQGCSDDRVAEYTSEANSILVYITACAEGAILLDKNQSVAVSVIVQLGDSE